MEVGGGLPLFHLVMVSSRAHCAQTTHRSVRHAPVERRKHAPIVPGNNMAGTMRRVTDRSGSDKQRPARQWIGKGRRGGGRSQRNPPRGISSRGAAR